MHEGLDLSVVAALAAVLLCWSLVSLRLERWNLTGPICFVAIGMVIANGPLKVIHPQIGSEGVRQVAEFALAVVRFDATRRSRAGSSGWDFHSPSCSAHSPPTCSSPELHGG